MRFSLCFTDACPEDILLYDLKLFCVIFFFNLVLFQTNRQYFIYFFQWNTKENDCEQ